MSVEVLEGLKRKLTFGIKKDDVQASAKAELKKYAKTAKIQGFRPGKVPTNIVEQMYGGQAFEESLNKHLNQQFKNLIIEHKIELASSPEFDLANSEGEEFIFAAIFEVMPEVIIGDLAVAEIEHPQCEINDEIIEKTLLNLRKKKATYLANPEKIAENNDRVTIDFVGTIDGVEFEGGSSQNHSFILGEGKMLPEFEAGILGHKIGETINVPVTFPQAYHAEALQGKQAIFKITINNIETEQLPELNEEFIKSLGISEGTETKLREEVRTNLEREIKRRLYVKTRENALKILNECSPLDVPHQLVHDEIHHMMDKTKEYMQKQGYQNQQINLTHDMFEKDAKLMVTTRLLVQEFIRQNELKINDDEVKAVVLDMAALYEDKEGYISWYYTDETRVNNARAIAMENKVIDKILEKSIAKPAPIDFDELINLQI
ncbi:MAG: trigger factor [Burkholderiales bacterium]|nr:trigger factor [Burkholderiales bacterium]